MSLILKKSQHLIALFKGVNTQDSFIINKNINDTEHLLKTPSDAVRKIMEKQNVHAEDLLAEKNLILTRFYLSEDQTQLSTFLDCELLALLFKALPMAEATIFKRYVLHAQAVLPLPDIKLQSSLVLETLNTDADLHENNIERIDNIVDFQTGYAQQTYLHKLQSLADSLYSPDEGDYEACFYLLEQVANPEGQMISTLVIKSEYEEGAMLYCELSPLMQMKAQQLSKETNFKSLSATA